MRFLCIKGMLKSNFFNSKIKSSSARRITPRRAESAFAPGQRGSEETQLRWQAVGDVVSDLTDPGIERKT